MTNRVCKGVYPKVFGHSYQLSQIKFFDPSTPSMRKGCDGEKKWKRMTFTVATNIVASRPPKRRRMERLTLVPKLLMTPQLDRHRETDPKRERYQLSKPEIEFAMIKEMYVALGMHTCSENTSF